MRTHDLLNMEIVAVVRSRPNFSVLERTNIPGILPKQKVFTHSDSAQELIT